MAEKLDHGPNDGADNECADLTIEGIEHTALMCSSFFAKRLNFLIARVRELESKVELGSNLLREQTDKTCAANLRLLELESASQPDEGGEAVKVDAVRANFTPFYIMSNVRRIVPAHYNKQRANWVLAMDVFAVGSRSAHRICEEAGIDPDGFTVERAAPSAGNGGAEGA